MARSYLPFLQERHRISALSDFLDVDTFLLILIRFMDYKSAVRCPPSPLNWTEKWVNLSAELFLYFATCFQIPVAKGRKIQSPA